LKKDASGHGGACTLSPSLRCVSFGYIGQINQPLLGAEKEELGHVDVSFNPWDG